jgi:flavin reductase (DIM6/NTAB) family NADH-FMN oxidoreductase RutF
MDGQLITDSGFLPENDQRAFRNALGRFATGVCVITTMGEAGPVGFTANSFAAVSLDPPLVLWSPAKTSSRHGLFSAAAHFSIHVLAQDQDGLAARFVRGGAGFDGLDHLTTPEGTPVIPGTLARFDCSRHAAHDAGDHTIVLGRVRHAFMTEGAPLVFNQGRYGGFQTLPTAAD